MDVLKQKFVALAYRNHLWFARRGFHNYGYEHKLTAFLTHPFDALRELLHVEDSVEHTADIHVALLQLEGVTIDDVKQRSFAGIVVQFASKHPGIFTDDEVATARRCLRSIEA